MQLDDIDRGILRMMQEDAQTPYSIISEKLGVSKATIHKRIWRMRSEGIIKGFTVIIDPAAVGKGIKAFVGISTSPGGCQRVIEELGRRPEVLEIHEMAGEHDLLLKVVLEDTERLNVFLHEIDRVEGVAGSRTYLVLKTEKETTTVDI
jgi:Lrp/AsnC family transcriptional regulator for asnA, asnC and gidA